MLDYKLIEALAMVVQEGGFEKASRVLHLTQSAVSQRVRQLEDKTGQILLSRMNPPQLTPLGRKMLKHYRQVRLLEDGLSGLLPSGADKGFTSLALGVNADSLATWFPAATQQFLEQEKVVFDLRVEDQDETHRLLKNGDVVGCISTSETPMQGCRLEYLGRMVYRLLASPLFAERWFANGLSCEAVQDAPGILFNRKDTLNSRFFQSMFGSVELNTPSFFVPSSERFVDLIVSGLAYGMLPDQQSQVLVDAGILVDLVPARQLSVKLYWHCWSLESDLLRKLTRNLTRYAPEWLTK